MATESARRIVSFVVAGLALTTPLPSRADDDVNVRGTSAENLERSSGSGSQVSRTEIARAQPLSLTEVFRRVPGLNVRQEDGMGLRLNLGVRGLNPSRGRLVLVQEDGVPVVVSPYGEPELYYSTPIERVERVDLVKGHEMVLFGPQTVGGVVNLYTWAPPAREAWSVEADYGQRAYARGLARYGNAVGDVRYLVQVSHKQGDGFRAMPFDATDLMAKVTFPTGRDGEATAKLTVYDESSHTTYVGLTQGMFQSDPRRDSIAPSDVFGIRRYEVSLRHEQRLGANTTLRSTLFGTLLDLKIYQQDFDRDRAEGADYERVVGTEGVVGSAIYFRPTRALRDRGYQVAGVEPQVEHRFATGSVDHRLVVGARAIADVARRTLSRGARPDAEAGDLLSDDTTSILGLAGYVQDRISFGGKLLVTPGMRLERAYARRHARRVFTASSSNVDAAANDGLRGVPRDVDLQGRSASTGLMPGLGFAAGKPALNIFWGIHSGYSPPRVSQSITPTGQDTGLSAERSMNYEIGARARPLRAVRLEATGFVIAFDNQLVSNNTLSGSSAEFKNGGKTRHIGAEVTALAHLPRALSVPVDVDVSAQYTYVRSTFAGGAYEGNFVPYSPSHAVTATLDAEHASGFGAQASYSHVSAQFADESNTVDPDVSGRSGLIAGYGVLDLGVRYKHAPTGLSFHFTVKNALDEVYLSGRLPNGIFTSGFRQIGAGIKWSGS